MSHYAIPPRLPDVREYIIWFVLLAMFIAMLVFNSGCVASPTQARIQRDVAIRAVDLSPPNEAQIEFVNRSDYSHIVQEVHLPGGHTLVECFRLSRDQSCIDFHRWSSIPHRRWMRVYAANVEGAYEVGRFAHLPDNGAGLKTSLPPNFNTFYRALCPVPMGRITARSPHWFVWRIDATEENVSITLPQRER